MLTYESPKHNPGYLDSEFEPMFRLIKQFPGMCQPVGTIFGKVNGWSCLATQKGVHYTGWEMDYFTPWVGEFFERVYRKTKRK